MSNSRQLDLVSHVEPSIAEPSRGAASTEFLLYETVEGHTRAECRLVDDSLWLSQALKADLFQISKQNVNLYVKNALAEGGTSQVRRKVQLYDLETIRAAGYLLKSPRGSHKKAPAHSQAEYAPFTAQRRAALETYGEGYTVRMLGMGSTDEKALCELGQVAKRLKKKGGHDAS
jgi:hypothetical protein